MSGTPDATGRVFVAGGTGFVGRHVLRGLLGAGLAVTALVRAGHGGSLGAAAGARLHLIEAEWTRPATWAGFVAGHAVAINCVGIIRERPGASFEAVHTRAAVALCHAAATGGVGQLVQLSALGADARAVSAFQRTKRAADDAALAGPVPAVVLRPSLIYGPGDHSMSFFERLAALPVAPVPGDGRYRVQPIHVDDIVRAVLDATTRPGRHGVYDVGGGSVLTFDALLEALARRRGRSSVPKLHLPWPLMRGVACLTDRIGHGPITTGELRMLRRGSVADNTAFGRAFGFSPRPFA